MEESFKFNGHMYSVDESTLLGASRGLFARSKVTQGAVLFPYNGPKYRYDEWRDLCGQDDRMKIYALREGQCDTIDTNDDCRSYGNVETGNVAGYINSSKHCKEKTNACWEYAPNLTPWIEDNHNVTIDDYGFVVTIAIKDINIGDEI